VVIDRHCQHFFRLFLANNIIIKMVADFMRGRQRAALTMRRNFFNLFANNVVTQVHTFVADIHGRPGDQLTHFMLAFAAKRAIQQFARTIFAFICHESKPLNLFFVPHMTTQMPFQAQNVTQA
jgi:hypothetical protein